MSEARSRPTDDRTTPDLVRAAAGGDVPAFGRLVVRYEARIRAVALARGLDPAAAEDAAQESFTAAFRSLSRLSDPAAFPAWLAGIADHVAVSALRRRGLAPSPRPDLERLPVADPRAGPEEAALRASLVDEVRGAL